MSGHTPGPWQVTIATYDRGGWEAQKQHISIFDESGEEAIASYSTEYSEYPDDEVNAANARLIAAAPTYYEAGVEFRAYESALAAGDDTAAMQHYARASELIAEAHAKATGAQP